MKAKYSQLRSGRDTAVAASISPVFRWEAKKPTVRLRSRPADAKRSVVRQSTTKATMKASATRPIVIMGVARKRAATFSIMVDTKTNITRIFKPSIRSFCRLTAARPTIRRSVKPTRAEPAWSPSNLRPSSKGEIASALPMNA